jgi:putative Mg2+ transporter-C (MgtC) family protein
MSIDWNLILRLVIAGLMGGIIGLERESRAKEAGIRTHFIVALGSALFMIISQYAFNGRFDAARVAAQVVSGIGFLGAGVIIFQKNVIRGVTTAAGLWVVAAIGLACGAGMYVVAGTATVLTAICLEMMHFFHLHYGEKLVDIKLDTHGNKDLATVMDALEKAKISVESYSVFEGKVHLSLRMPTRHYAEQLHTLFELLEGFNIEELS